MDSEIPRFPQHHTTIEIEAALITQQVAAYLHACNQNLNTNNNIGVKFTSHEQIVAIDNLKIGHIGSKLILFKGISMHNNTPIELLQHITQLNFQLSSFKRNNPYKLKHPIGFLKR